MLLVERHLGTTSPRSGEAPADTSSLRLRFEDRIVELQPGKTTIGSSPRCGLRIERPGIAPVHCVVVWDKGQILVRRWAVDTRLNGESFDEARLEVGDCLTLAGVKLQLEDALPTSEPFEESMRKADEAANACDAWLKDEAVPRDDGALDAEIDSAAEIEGGGIAGVGIESLTSEPLAVADKLASEAEACEKQDSETELTADPALTSEADTVAKAVVEAAFADSGEVEERPGVAEVRGAAASSTFFTTAEIVFQELQLACGISRGRGRKLLAALRAAREANDRLFGQLESAREELAELRRERAEWREAQSEQNESRREFESEVRGLRREIADLECRLADHTQGMAELKTKLTELPVGLREPVIMLDASPAVRESQGEIGANREGSTAGQSLQADAYLPEDTSVADAELIERRPAGDTGYEAGLNNESALEGEAKALNCSKLVLDAGNAVAVNCHLANDNGAAVSAAVEETSLPPVVSQASYIERFAHLFADESAGDAGQSSKLESARPTGEPLVMKPRTMGIVRNEGPAAGSVAGDDEESIEQYMSKLLQRVRGDGSSGDAVRTTAPAADVVEEKPAADGGEESASVTAASDANSAWVDAEDGDETEVSVNWEALTQRVAAPTTDLGALRALANESARRAIGRHGSKKHRREAKTKVIIACLAGMTSLWLMLQSANWRDIQFLAACMSLLVAAYCAGNAVRAMLQSFRAAAYGGPAVRNGEMELESSSALPIDVEGAT